MGYLLVFCFLGVVVISFLMGANKNKSVEEQRQEDIEQMKALRKKENKNGF